MTVTDPDALGCRRCNALSPHPDPLECPVYLRELAGRLAVSTLERGEREGPR